MAIVSPETKGASAWARARALAVSPAAAGRSSGATRATVKAWRVGTSICDSTWRARSTAAAASKLGMKGTAMSRTFDGRCVKTIVFRRPIRSPTRAATRKDKAESRFVPKKSAPSASGPAPKRR
jgi:hypothetical protein